MAEHPHTISISELDKAVVAAVHQLQHEKTHAATELSRSVLIMGRWLREVQIAQPEAEAAAKEITRQVSAKIAGFKADPFAISGHGGTTMGFVLREE